MGVVLVSDDRRNALPVGQFKKDIILHEQQTACMNNWKQKKLEKWGEIF